MLIFFIYVVSLLLYRVVLGLVQEVFVCRVFAVGKVTIPLRVRDLLGIKDGDYVRLSLIEVVRKTERREGKRKTTS